jgi:hypothetical protein
MELTYDSLADSISAEIMRVSQLRENARRAAAAAGQLGEARRGLYFLDQAMHFARLARDEGDEAEMAIALRALRDIKS